MVKDSMVGALRKSGLDGDVDFLREALRVLNAIMDALIGAEHERSPDR